LIIAGDFNVDLLQNNYLSNTWSHIFESNGFHQLVTEPTRVTNSSSTLIDHVLSRECIKIQKTQVSVLKYCISDHYPVMISLSLNKHRRKKQHDEIKYRDFKHFNEIEYLNDLQNADWDKLDRCVNPGEALLELEHIINAALDKHAPIKQKRIKKTNKPAWLTKEIICAIRKRNRLRSKGPSVQFKYAKKHVKRLINLSKSTYYQSEVHRHKHNPGNIWKIYRDLMNPGQEEKLITIEENHLPITNPVEVANAFNAYFTTPLLGSDRILTDAESPPSSTPQFAAGYNIPYINSQAVKMHIDNLSAKKATGIDGLSSKILKMSSSVISKAVATICNLSITTGVFPQRWKHAKVKPLHKGGSKLDKANYRPISVLPVLSKILERHVHTSFSGYLEQHSFLTAFQSGFRQNYSCQTALTCLTDGTNH